MFTRFETRDHAGDSDKRRATPMLTAAMTIKRIFLTTHTKTDKEPTFVKLKPTLLGDGHLFQLLSVNLLLRGYFHTKIVHDFDGLSLSKEEKEKKKKKRVKPRGIKVRVLYK